MIRIEAGRAVDETRTAETTSMGASPTGLNEKGVVKCGIGSQNSGGGGNCTQIKYVLNRYPTGNVMVQRLPAGKLFFSAFKRIFRFIKGRNIHPFYC